jgi:hypothetical protein
MNPPEDDVDRMVRRAIGGDPRSIAWISANATGSADPTLITLSAVLEDRLDGIRDALAIATSTRDRQVAAIADAHLRGRHDLVQALAREHLADHPSSFIVAWLASGGTGDGGHPDGP